MTMSCIYYLHIDTNYSTYYNYFNYFVHYLYMYPCAYYPIGPRDLCLTRYWKNNSDGSFVICIDSSYHVDCPLIDNHVRGELHGVYVIAPLKDGEDEEEQMECSLTFIGQVSEDCEVYIFVMLHFLYAFFPNSLSISTVTLLYVLTRIDLLYI